MGLACLVLRGRASYASSLFSRLVLHDMPRGSDSGTPIGVHGWRCTSFPRIGRFAPNTGLNKCNAYRRTCSSCLPRSFLGGGAMAAMPTIRPAHGHALQRRGNHSQTPGRRSGRGQRPRNESTPRRLRRRRERRGERHRVNAQRASERANLARHGQALHDDGLHVIMAGRRPAGVRNPT